MKRQLSLTSFCGKRLCFVPLRRILRMYQRQSRSYPETVNTLWVKNIFYWTIYCISVLGSLQPAWHRLHRLISTDRNILLNYILYFSTGPTAACLALPPLDYSCRSDFSSSSCYWPLRLSGTTFSSNSVRFSSSTCLSGKIKSFIIPHILVTTNKETRFIKSNHAVSCLWGISYHVVFNVQFISKSLDL